MTGKKYRKQNDVRASGGSGIDREVYPTKRSRCQHGYTFILLL